MDSSRLRIVSLSLVVALPGGAFAQHDHDHGAEPASAAPPVFSEGSGTSWLPASTEHTGSTASRGAWDLMLHYSVFAGIAVQENPDWTTEGTTANWVMGMARYETKGVLLLRGMLSFEAPFLGRDGYPLLMQTGETAYGQPLVDRQHPHDLFMELAAKYDIPMAGGASFEAYLAPAGEPALGPPAFMHRPSAAFDPMAPLGHHWEDSTHIAFGVLTAGVFWDRVKLEASLFNGREPDEHRYNFDFAPLDSYSARIAFNPSPRWSLQVSAGHLTEPEELEPGVDVRRVTASLIYVRPGSDGSWASTLVWGMNTPEGGRDSSALLAETAWTFGPHAVFGRAEYVQKAGHDFGMIGADAELRLPVGELAAGYSYRFASFQELDLAVGGRGSVGFVGDTLSVRYDSSRPLSAAVFLQLRPAKASEHHH